MYGHGGPAENAKRALKSTLNDCKVGAHHLADIVRGSVMLDDDAAFEAVVKCLSGSYIANRAKRCSCRKVEDRCKKPLPGSRRDVLYNMNNYA